MLVIIAVAVGVTTQNWLAANNVLQGSAFASGAASAAAGSAVSQAIGVATGIQEKFSWNQVGLAALSGGFARGMQSGGPLAGKGLGRAVARGALGNAATQALGVATGLQSKFSWAGVAASGVGAGAGTIAGDALGNNASQFVRRSVTTTAAAIASAATHSAINGSSFGDNLRAAVPNVIGHAIGGAIVGGGGAKGSSGDPDAAASSVVNAFGQAANEGMRSATDEWFMGFTDLMREPISEASGAYWDHDVMVVMGQKAVIADIELANAQINLDMAQANYRASKLHDDQSQQRIFWKNVAYRQQLDEFRAGSRGIDYSSMSSAELMRQRNPLLFKSMQLKAAGQAMRRGEALTDGQAYYVNDLQVRNQRMMEVVKMALLLPLLALEAPTIIFGGMMLLRGGAAVARGVVSVSRGTTGLLTRRSITGSIGLGARQVINYSTRAATGAYKGSVRAVQSLPGNLSKIYQQGLTVSVRGMRQSLSQGLTVARAKMDDAMRAVTKFEGEIFDEIPSFNPDDYARISSARFAAGSAVGGIAGFAIGVSHGLGAVKPSASFSDKAFVVTSSAVMGAVIGTTFAGAATLPLLIRPWYIRYPLTGTVAAIGIPSAYNAIERASYLTSLAANAAYETDGNWAYDPTP